MVLAGSGEAIWHLAARHIPRKTQGFEEYLSRVGRADARSAREQLYRNLVPADFSREVLQVAHGLAVVPLIDSGWFDCGTPERLFEWLRATPEMEPMLVRLQTATARSARKPAAVHAAARTRGLRPTGRTDGRGRAG